MTSIQFGHNTGLSPIQPQAIKNAQLQQAGSVLFGNAGDQLSPATVMKSRLLGIQQALGDTLKVTSINIPGNLNADSRNSEWNEARLAATLEGPDGRAFNFSSTGYMSGRSFELKSADGKTEYSMNVEAGRAQVNGLDRREGKTFNLQTGIMEQGHKHDDLFLLASNIRGAIIEEIKSFQAKQPQAAAPVVPDSDF